MLLYLTRKDPSDPPEDWLPLYYRDDAEEVFTAKPIFDKLGLVRLGPSPQPTALVHLSSDDQSSEATEDEVVEESSALRQRELLRDFPDDDDNDEPQLDQTDCLSPINTRIFLHLHPHP